MMQNAHRPRKPRVIACQRRILGPFELHPWRRAPNFSRPKSPKADPRLSEPAFGTFSVELKGIEPSASRVRF